MVKLSELLTHDWKLVDNTKSDNSEEFVCEKCGVIMEVHGELHYANLQLELTLHHWNKDQSEREIKPCEK